jgi:hypothetical protein
MHLLRHCTARAHKKGPHHHDGGRASPDRRDQTRPPSCSRRPGLWRRRPPGRYRCAACRPPLGSPIIAQGGQKSTPASSQTPRFPPDEASTPNASRLQGQGNSREGYRKLRGSEARGLEPRPTAQGHRIWIRARRNLSFRAASATRNLLPRQGNRDSSLPAVARNDKCAGPTPRLREA